MLLDDEHRPAGTMAKADVHGPDTPLHLAFSVYVFDRRGRFLVTRRALSKRTWGGVWSNTCCGHPAPDEPVDGAARRRLAEELGLPVDALEVVLPDFQYRAVSPEGMVEHEVCPVLVASTDRDPRPDPDEVVEWRWVEWPAFRAAATATPWLLSPWSVLQVAQLPADLPTVLDRAAADR